MIPLVLHQVWVGSAMPAELAAFCAGWRALHPAWEYRLWSEPEIDAFGLRNRELYDRAGEIAQQRAGAFKADIARYEILLTQGGVYLDCDIEPRKPLDPIIAAGHSAFATWERTGQWVTNAVMGSEPGAPLLKELVTGLSTHVERQLTDARVTGRPAPPHILSGPHYLTSVYQRHTDWLTVLPKAWFHPYLYSELDRGREAFPDAYGVHHWHTRRTERAVMR
jgi:mannosyltransferase OCH1-like enzyme